MKYIRLDKDIVAEIISEFDPIFPNTPLSERYPAEFVKKLIKAEDETTVEVGMKYSADKGFFIESVFIPLIKTLSETIKNKLDELSEKCSEKICGGIEHNGRHYSMSITDQLNMASLFNEISNGAEKVIYHADNEPIQFFTADSFMEIYTKAQQHKTKETSYFNLLKQYVLSLENIDAVESVYYGQPQTGEFLESYNNIMSSL